MLDPMNDSIEELRRRLNGETGKLGWNELERHFARGVLVKLGPGLDLVEVAAAMIRDDKAAVESWLASGRIARASGEDAVAWNARRPEFRAVVTAPWVLVQEITQ